MLLNKSESIFVDSSTGYDSRLHIPDFSNHILFSFVYLQTREQQHSNCSTNHFFRRTSLAFQFQFRKNQRVVVVEQSTTLN